MLAGDIVDDDSIRAFAQQLGAAIFLGVLGLRGEADDELAGAAAARDLGKNVLSGRELERERTGALELLLGNGDGAIVGDGSGLDDERGLVHAFEDGRAHLLGGDDLDDFAMRGRMQRRRPADEDDARAAAVCGLGKRVAHFAAGAVADEADGVERLAGAAGGDENDFTCQVVAAAHGAENDVGNGFRLRHAAGAHRAAGEQAGAGLNDAHTALTQGFKIGLGGGVIPHVGVHGRSHEDRNRGGQIERGEKIVGNAVREFGEDVGGCGRDYESVGPLRLADVLDGAFVVGGRASRGVVPASGIDLMAGERGEGERLHKVRGRLGHDYVHLDRLLLQCPHQLRRLVGGNATGNADRHSHDSIVVPKRNKRPRETGFSAGARPRHEVRFERASGSAR